MRGEKGVMPCLRLVIRYQLIRCGAAALPSSRALSRWFHGGVKVESAGGIFGGLGAGTASTMEAEVRGLHRRLLSSGISQISPPSPERSPC